MWPYVWRWWRETPQVGLTPGLPLGLMFLFSVCQVYMVALISKQNLTVQESLVELSGILTLIYNFPQLTLWQRHCDPMVYPFPMKLLVFFEILRVTCPPDSLWCPKTDALVGSSQGGGLSSPYTFPRWPVDAEAGRGWCRLFLFDSSVFTCSLFHPPRYF